jgi:RHS repeat-associated protein
MPKIAMDSSHENHFHRLLLLSLTACNQEYVTDMQECDAAGNCTLVTASTTETFNALPGDNSSFGGWGELCFGLANQSGSHTITSEYAAENDVLNVTATFDPEPAPQDATYTYNHLGQRASKTTGGTTTYFVYSDLDGQLLGEYTSTGSPIREYIYLEGERVAMYDHTTVEPKDSTNTKAIVYLHNDQVGQVQYAYNSDGQIIYERVQTPFGETMSEMNVYNVQIPVRFPGQYYDSETGFNQNWNRDYDPSLGRYVQSDPIGLGGWSKYVWVCGAEPCSFDRYVRFERNFS